MTIQLYNPDRTVPTSGWGESRLPTQPQPANPLTEARETGKREGVTVATLLTHTAENPMPDEVPPLTWKTIQQAVRDDDTAPVARILRDVAELMREGIEQRMKRWFQGQPLNAADDLQLQIDGVKWYFVAAGIEEWLRGEADEASGERKAVLDEIRGVLKEMAKSRGLSL